MGRSEESNMGLPILGIQYLVNYSFLDYVILRMVERKNGSPKDEGSY
jgi:hypothetical protein